MPTNLTAIKAALSDLADAELHALIAASNGAPPIAYGLLVWIEGACANLTPWRQTRSVACVLDSFRGEDAPESNSHFQP